jgi:hypothetical protein
MPELKDKIGEMTRDLAHGRIQGFPGTMFLSGKPTFADLDGFYEIVFDLADHLP